MPNTMFSLGEQFGPSVNWPSFGDGWILRCTTVKEIDLIFLLQHLDQIFDKIERLNPISLADYYGSELACLDQYQNNKPFFYTSLCSFMATKLLPDLTIQFEWNQSIEAGFVAGVPNQLLGRTLHLCCELLAQLTAEENLLSTALLSSSLRHCNQDSQDFFKHPFTKSVVDYLQNQSIPFIPIILNNNPGFPVIHIGECANSLLMHSTSISGDSLIGGLFCSDKRITHDYLSSLGISTPRQHVISIDAIQVNFSEMQTRLDANKFVVKPDQSERGYGITLNVSSQDALLCAIDVAKPFSRNNIILQEQLDGFYYRLSVVHGQIIRIYRAQPPFVLADGIRTFESLVRDFIQPLGHGEKLSRSEAYKAFVHQIQTLGFSEKDVAPKAMKVIMPFSLTDRGNWIVDDLNPHAYPFLSSLAKKIGVNLNLQNFGIDIICDDIDNPLSLPFAKVIELNAVQTLPTHCADLFVSTHPCSRMNFRIDKSVVVVRKFSLFAFKQFFKYISDSTVIAFQHNTFDCDQEKALNEIFEGRLVVYKHPREIILNRQIASVCFLVSSSNVGHSGIPLQEASQYFVLDDHGLHRREGILNLINS